LSVTSSGSSGMPNLRDTLSCLLEPDVIDPALLAEFGRALALREIENMLSAYWQRLVAAGKAAHRKDGYVYRRYDAAGQPL
jgi:hypothetical protein